MRRFRSGEDSPVMLFPFLSILACVIGVLTLAITGLVVGQLDGGQARAAEYAQLDKQIDKDRTDAERLRQELAQAKKRKTTGEESIVLKPSGSGKGTKPEFVECTANGLFLHSSGSRIDSDGIAADDLFKQLIDRVKQRTGWAIVFLVRPSDAAVNCFDEARRLTEREDAPYGYLALPHNGKIDFSELTPGKPDRSDRLKEK